MAVVGGGCNQLWQCWRGGVINYGSVGGGV